MRLIPGIFTEELMNFFHIKATHIGLLLNAFFFPYALLQIPAGIVVDRLGPRRALVLTSIFLFCGTLLFTFNLGYFTLALVGFALVGIGGAPIYLCCSKIIALNFYPRTTSIFMGLTIILGYGCTIFYTLLPLLAHQLGSWLTTLLLLTLLNVPLALLAWYGLTEKTGTLQISTNKSYHGLKNILKNKEYWLLGLHSALLYTIVPCFLRLWAIPFFKTAYGFSKGEATNVVHVSIYGIIIGILLFSFLAKRLTAYKYLLASSAFVAVLAFYIIVYYPYLTKLGLVLLLFILGFAVSGQSLVYTSANLISPKDLSGTAVGFVNFISTMIPSTFFTFLVSYALDFYSIGVYTTQVYQHAFSAISIAIIGGLVLTFFMKK
ncbi:MAG: hypothetical protein RLZ12_322 [Bacillota bacterium]|jgi:sugar phosphate permease